MSSEKNVAVRVESGNDFVKTPFMDDIFQRGLAWLESGFPVHFSGSAGTGKTTMALHLAGLLGRPIMLIYGDEEFGSSDLIGSNKGVVTKRLVDNFIHSVMKTEESSRSVWMDERLTTACKKGYTLLYDEFSRSHAEANNVLLSILEEGIIALPSENPRGNFMRVHPNFRAIFTSNPDEYAGVYSPQSALLDRMVTIKVGKFDLETEIAITKAKTGLSQEDCGRIVNIVRAAREGKEDTSVRACIMLGRIISHKQSRLMANDESLIKFCLDVFGFDSDCEGKIRQVLEKVLAN